MSLKEALYSFPVTSSLIVLNSIIYLLTALMGGDVIDMPAGLLVKVGALYGPLILYEGEWWRLVSAMFLHGGMTHLLMNMFSLYIVGRAAERYFDRKSYLAIYLFSGLIGGLASLWVHPQGVGVGASGAIFGVFGALAGFFWVHRTVISAYSKAFMKDFSLIIGINLFIGLAIPSVDLSAHIGGLIVGGIGGLILSKNPRLFGVYMIVMILMTLLFGRYLVAEYGSILL